MFLIEGGGKAVLYTGDIRCKAHQYFNVIRRLKEPLQLSHGGSTHL